MKPKHYFLFIVLLWLSIPGARLAAQQDDGALLLISEIDVDPPGRDEEGEWVELLYLGETPLALGDYKVGDEEQLGGSGEGMFRFPDEAVAAPGQVLVIARNAVAFRARFGASPDFEFYGADPVVPDMRPYRVWAGGDLFLANDGDELLLAGPDNVIRDAVNWGDSQRFFIPALPIPLPGQTLARSPADCDSNSAADWLIVDQPSPGTADLTGDCQAAAPGAEVSPVELTGPIGAIQGDGAVSPYLDQVVTFRGIVTGIQEDRNMRGAIFYTLFVQDDPADADGDPATSDAIGVFTATARPTFHPGDVVQVRGRVSEFYGLTEIDFRDLEIVPLSSGNPLPPPVELTSLSQERLEPYETMVVALPEVRVTGPTHTGCGFAVAMPDTPLPQLHEEPLASLPRVLPVLHQSNVSCSGFPDVKREDLVRGLAGPLTYQFDQYQLVQQNPAQLQITPAPLAEPAALAPAGPDAFTVASVNFQDYFAADPHLAVRRAKFVQLLATYLRCPAIIAVQEVENAALLEDIAAELGPLCHTSYAVAHRDGPDERGIDVALLADAGRARIVNIQAHQGCTELETGIDDPTALCAAGLSPLHSRPPLQVDAEIEGTIYSFYVNHLKSKREGEAETAAWRLAQATHLAGLVTEQLEAAPDAPILVLGDFNDLPQSTPIEALLAAAPLIDPLRNLPADSRYTYVFSGLAEMLDTILLTPAAAATLVDSGILHMNADYPAAWLSDPATPFHASDHDVPWVTLRLPREAAPAPTTTEPGPTATLPGPSPAPPLPTVIPAGSAPPPEDGRLPLVPVAIAVAGTVVLLVALVVGRRRRR